MQFSRFGMLLHEYPKLRYLAAGTGFLMMLLGGLLLWANLQFKLLLNTGEVLIVFAGLFVCFMILGGAYLILLAWQGQKQTLKKVRLNRQRIRLTPQGMTLLILMLVFLIASMLSRSNMLILLFSFIAGSFIVNGGMGMKMVKGALVRRRIPAAVMAGEKFAVNIEYTNTNRFRSAWVMVVRDIINHTSETLQAEVLIARILPRQTASTYYDFRPMRRGIYKFGPLEVVTSSPLGMVERGHVFDVQNEITVYPAVGRLTSYWKKERSNAAELVQQKQTRKGVFDDEYHSMREYRPGDNPRAIHWRTTARRNEVMVREFHQSRDDDVLLLLDLWLPHKAQDEHYERVEDAVSFAATICLEQMQQSRDSKFTVLVNGETPLSWSGHSSPLGTDEVLTTLAIATAGTDTSLASWMEEARYYRTGSTSLILVTTRPESELQSLQLLLEAAFDEPVLNVTQVSVDSDLFKSFYLLPELV
ncbi:MAG: DUF58 domain-containing protein [Planctomycetaceae bacterium]